MNISRRVTAPSSKLAPTNNHFPSYLKIEARIGSKFGRGVFATKDISAGEVLCKMQGPLISTEEHIKMYGSLMFTDPMQIAQDLYIDLIEPYRSFNHSCNPNAGIRNNGIVFALSKIKSGDEIFYDYSTTCDDPNWVMECGCGEGSCRKIITEFLSIPHKQRQLYLSKNAILAYIQATYF